MERHSLRGLYGRRLFRGALFASTALVLPAVAPRVAMAQIAATTTPQGGVVVGGSASITQVPASTTIDQSSQRAAIDWQSFDVGAAAKVQFNQPDASAIALNRVTGGNLSQINGQISANGQIVLINQSGVVFGRGAQVNAESVVVSTSDIPTSDFMAGRMNFSGPPNPGAKIVNNGKITARDAGLVGLVAPQVINRGVITAELGQVVLAGAAAFTLDLYGDRLISLDVTRAVRAVDVGGKLVPALVTNGGLIVADGGRVTLTAQDADALVTQLINAGGTIRADTVGAQTGTISLSGIGGNIRIAGNLLARGSAAGTQGGAIQALTDGTVAVVAGADLDVSGDAGGGVIALGTDLARARNGPADAAAPTAAAVTIESGAALHADATGRGDAGTVTLLSRRYTGFQGAVTAQGGPRGGNGGRVEISSDGVISLGGTVLDTAIDGQAGEILLDPATLYVESGQTTIGPTSTAGGTTVFGGAGGGVSYVDPSELDSLSGTIDLQASTLISVLDDLRLSNASALSLMSGGDVSITAFITLPGSLEIDAGGSIYIGPGIVDLPVGGPSFTSTGGLIAGRIALNGGAGIQIDAPVMTGTLALQSASGPIMSGTQTALLGAVEETVQGSIQTTLLTGGPTIIGGLVSLTNPGNVIGTLQGIDVSGALDLADATSMTVGSGISAAAADLSAAGFSITGLLSVANALTLQSIGGDVNEDAGAMIAAATLGLSDTGADSFSLNGTANAIGALAAIRNADKVTNLFLTDAETLRLPNRVTIGSEFVFDGVGGAGLTESGAGLLNVAQLRVGGAAGDVALGGHNTLGEVGVAAGGTLNIYNATSLTVLTSITGADVYVTIGTAGGALDFLDSSTGVTATGAGGTLLVVADQLGTVTPGLFAAPTGTIGLAPFTATDGIVVDAAGAGGAGTLALTDTFVESLGTAAREVVLGNSLMSGTISLGATGTDSATLGTATLMLLTTGSIGETGTLAAATLGFGAAAFNEDTAGTIIAGLVGGTASGGSISLEAAANQIGTLGAMSATGNILVDDGLAGTLLLEGVLTTTGTITLGNEAGGIAEGSGVIDAGTLTTGTGSIAGDAILGNANRIGDLDMFDVSAGNLLLNDAGTLAISGAVSSPGLVTLQDASGGIFEAGGSITAATLSSGGSEISGNVSLGGANAVGTLANFLLGGGFGLVLNDPATALTLAGTDSAANVTLNAAQISLTGALAATGMLLLDSQTGVFQSAGSLTAGTLSGAVAMAGDFSLASMTNNFGTVGGLTLASGNILLTDPRDLQITGAVSTPDALTLSVSSVGETGGGLIDAGTLDNALQLASLSLGGANSITSLAGDFILAAGGDFYLNNQPAIELATEIAGGGVTFGGGGVTESGAGFIGAATLSSAGTIAGDMLLTNTSNTIGVVDGLTLTGTLDLADTGNLGLGALRAAAATFSNGTAGASLDLFGSVSVTGALELGFLDGLDGGTGGITAATLASGGIEAGSISFGGANLIGKLSAFNALGDVLLNDAATLDIAGALTAQDVTLSAPGLLLNAAVTAGSAPAPGTLALVTDKVMAGAAGALDAPAGTIAVAPLSYTTIDLGGTMANALDLPGTIFGPDTANIIIGAALGSQAVSIVVDQGRFGTATVDLSASNGITDIGTLAAGTLDFNGGGLVQSGGTAAILATLLAADAPINGPVALTGTLNQIGTLGPMTLTGGHDFALNDQVSLSVTGGVLAKDITIDDLVAIALGAPLSVASGGTIQLASNALTTLAGTAPPITAPGATGTVLISPYTPGMSVGIDLGGTSTGGLELSNALLQLIGAGILRIGTLGGGGITAEGAVSISPNELVLTGASLDVTGTLAGPGLLSLAVAGSISERAAAAIDFATLAGFGAGAGLIGGNMIGTIGDVSAGGDIILNDLASVVIEGLVSAGGSISLEGVAFREAGAGALTALALNSGGATIGGDVFLTGANSIATLADFYVSPGATLAFNDAEPLALGGTIVADTQTLAAGSIDFGGDLTASSLLALAASFVTQISGVITAGTLASLGSIGGNVFLTDSNAIATLAGFSLGAGDTLALTDGRALTLAGTDIAPNATLSAVGINFAGDFDAASLLLLSSSAAVSQSSGGITAGTLATGGTIGGALTLLGGNRIGTLGGIGATGNIAIGDSQSLDVAGLVSTTGTITLENTGEIDEIGSGRLAAAALNSGGLDIGGDVFLTNANAIAILADFSVATGHTLAFADAGALTLAGSIAAPSATFAASALDFTGAVTVPGFLALASTGNVTQASGVITAGTLASQPTIGGDVTILDANRIGTLSTFTVAAGHTLALRDAGLLTVAGPVVAPVAIFAAGTINLSGAITATQLALESSTGIVQTAGTIGAATLSAGGTTIGGNVFLTDANAISTIANVALLPGATLDVNDATSLKLSGSIFASYESFSAASLDFEGFVTAASLLALGDTGPVTQGAGTIQAGTLVSLGSIGGDVGLTGANAIGVLGNFAVGAGGTLALNDATALTLAGAIIGPAATFTAASLAISGSLQVSGPLALVSAGGVSEVGGTIAAGTLTSLGSLDGDVALTGHNMIGTLGVFAVDAGSSFTLDDQGLLTVAGPVSGPVISLFADTIAIPGSVAAGTLLALDAGTGISETGFLSTPTLTSGGNTIGGGETLAGGNTIGTLGDIFLTGDFTLTNTGTLIIAGGLRTPTGDVTLADNASITEAGGAIQAGTLDTGGTTLGGNLSLGGANTIANLGALTLGAGGTFNLADAGLLDVAGTVFAPVATLAVGALRIGGALEGTALALASAGTISESGGAIAEATLTGIGTIGGNASLGGGNMIGTLANITMANGASFGLTDLEALALAGTIVAPDATLTAPGLSFDGVFDAGDVLALTGASLVTEGAAGMITAGTLTSLGSVDGDVFLTGGTNRIGAIGSFTVGAGSTLALDDTGLLSINGPLAGPVITLSSGTIMIPGRIAATQLALESTGSITETTGAILAATLTSGGTTIGGDLALMNTNTIGTLGGIALAGDFGLVNTGTLNIVGALRTPLTVTLEDSGSVIENLGLMNVGTLTTGAGSIAGDALFTGASQSIGALGNVTVGGTLAVDDGLLNIAGTVFAPAVTLSAVSIAISGALDGTLLDLANVGTVTETTGIITAGTLTSGGALDGTVMLLNANNIGTLGGFTATGALALNDGAALGIAGGVTSGATITLEGAGNITELAGGTLQAPVLDSGGTTIGGAVSLLSANMVGQLGTFIAHGNLGFDDARSYAVTGLLASGGTLALAGAGLSETGGSISAATLVSIGTLGGGATLNGGNNILSLGNFGATGDLLLNDTAPLVLDGLIGIGGTLGLLDATNILQTGGAITAGVLTSDSGTIGSGATLNAGNRIATLGAFNATLGLALDDLIALSIAGPVTLGGTLAIEDPASITQTGGMIEAAALSSDGGSIGGVGLFNQAANQIGAIGALTAAGGLSVTDGRDLSLSGPVNTGTAGLYLNTGVFNITQTGGTIGAQLLAASGAGIRLGQANAIGTLGAVTANDLLVNGENVVAGRVRASNATITSPGTLRLAGTIDATGSLRLSSGGEMTQTNGVISAGDATLTSAAGISLAGAVQAAGTLLATSATSLQVSGRLTAASVDLQSTVYLTQTGGSIVGGAVDLFGGDGVFLSGTVLAAGALAIDSDRMVDDEAATLIAASADMAGGSAGVSLNGQNSVSGLLSVTGGAVYQTSGQVRAGTLDIAASRYGAALDGQVLAQSATITAPQTGTGIQLGGAISIAGGLALQSGTGITQTGGYVASGGIAASAGGTILLDGAIADTGAASLTGEGVTLGGGARIATGLTVRAGDFVQTQGSLSAGYANISAASYLGLNGAVSIAGGLDLTAGTMLVDNASLFAASADFAALGGNMILNGTNTVLNPFNASAAGSIIQASGGLIAPAATLIAGGDIDLAGAISVPGELDLIAGGDIYHDTGRAMLAAGTLAGRGARRAIFTAPTDFGTIGSFILQDSTFALDNEGPLTIIGPLVANAVSITAVGLVTLLGSPDGGLFIAGQAEPKTVQTPQPGDSVITVTPAANGGTPAILQTGTFYIDAGPQAANFAAFANQPATLFLQTLPDGTINFAPAPPAGDGLEAPSIDMAIALGTSGTVSGNVDLHSVLIISGTASQFTGTLDGVTGSAAAGKGNVNPFPKPAFQFNACPIGSVNCIILPIESLPSANPLQNFDIEERKRKRLNKNVALPGVAMRDF
jgi:filamentous hemagglutinin family protein